MGELKYVTIYLVGILWSVFFISLYLFIDFFYKAIQESIGHEVIPEAPDGLRWPFILSIFSLTFLSIGTYAVFMLGIHRLDTRLMLPWALVIGFKCIFGGIVLIYFSSFVTAWTLLQGMIYYSTTVLSFVGIYYCYLKVFVIKNKSVVQRLPVDDQLSIISMDDEKPKTIF